MNQRGTPTERIVIKDFPLLELSDDIRQFMATEFVQRVPCSDILFSRARNEDGSLTNFANGDRYMYVKAGFTPSLPKQVTIGGHNCRLWHSRQKSFVFDVVVPLMAPMRLRSVMHTLTNNQLLFRSRSLRTFLPTTTGVTSS